MPTTSLTQLNDDIVECEKCPRLIGHCHKIAETKKPEFKDWEYWGGPVPGFGDPRARVWIIGLAPAAHGANRTGRMFTGDSSGNWLYRALHEVGFASQKESISRDDGMKLRDVYISAAARCAPPDNKPSSAELERCAPFLEREFELLQQAEIILALGNIAFESAIRFMTRKGLISREGRLKFAHNQLFSFGRKQLLASYHPSRQNTQTGRLTEAMWKGVFDRLIELLNPSSAGSGLEYHPMGKGNLI